MQLKQYQAATLKRLTEYLQKLAQARSTISYKWDEYAWEQVRPTTRYLSRKNGVNELLPTVCFKIPTGGGKTLLAVKALDAIYNLYIGSQTGLVLWIVPTTQIYNQTYRNLRDRAHPYRQFLDMASAGRTLILEKQQTFSPADVREQLVVMLLMLPSANRQNKETLKIFQDRGGFEAFFPPEGQPEAQAALLKRVPNLDVYGAGDTTALTGSAIKTSLGNTLRLLRPVIVLDEGHKAYGELAQQTLHGFNPAFILELSATPTKESNVLVSISGQDVWREGMIKLPINIHSHVSTDWHEALRAGHNKRDELEKIAIDYQYQEGVYIRPINLIQVERTGEKQRLPGLIHAEDVRDYLITRCNVAPEAIAVKSSERDEIENIDLLDPNCPIRYIITKQALQEGWDCPFAYILTTLVNAKAPVSMTQLIGRVLRQPYARKTNKPALDESYVFFSSSQTGELVKRVYAALHDEGLDDVPGSVVTHEGLQSPAQSIELSIRPTFADYAGKVYLPCFVINDGGQFREIGYEMDILSRIDWEHIDLSAFDTLQLNPTMTGHTHVVLGLDGIASPVQVTDAIDLPLDLMLMTQQLLDMVPNPWVAYELADHTIQRLRRRGYSDDRIRRDLGFVINELKRTVVAARNEQAKNIFSHLLKTEQLRFCLITGCAGNAIPERIRARLGRKLRHPRTDSEPVRSLFDYTEEEFNETEAAVALYLDQQDWILWWCRNLVPGGYSLQGWQPQRVYTDFFAGQGLGRLDTVQVLEIKGLHLKNEDTDYKRELFKLCNDYSQPTPWDEIAQQFADHKINFQVVFEDEWQKVINALAQ
jgi:type III restriction enzyme